MVHFIRNSKNQTLIECEVYNNDLHSAVDIKVFGPMLLDLQILNHEEINDFINDVGNLDEIRGWWWEKEEWAGGYNSVDDFVKEKYDDFAKKWNLNYITD